MFNDEDEEARPGSLVYSREDKLKSRSDTMKLSGWQRFKKRWVTKETIIAWNVSSWFTIGQMTAGKAAIAWVKGAFPFLFSILGKTWGLFCGLITAMLDSIKALAAVVFLGH